MRWWKKGEFATLQGQLVEIIRPNHPNEWGKLLNVGVKLINDPSLHWVNPQQLQEVTDQLAPKVLFSKHKQLT